MSTFPHQRPRRLRHTGRLRDALADVTTSCHNLVYPVFVGDLGEKKPVASMPGVDQWPVELALEQLRRWIDLGLGAFIFFGVTDDKRKNATGDFAISPDAPVNRLLAAARDAGLDATLMADTCFCEYTDHGHCGVLTPRNPTPRKETPQRELGGLVDNDATLEQLGRAAVAQAKAGAQIIAPSGMMDGQVATIRGALDEAGYHETAIMSYSVKFCSSFYGPFRDAGGCSLGQGMATPQQELGGFGGAVLPGGEVPGDRRGYQMDFRRSREWQTELETDIAEGADIVMVKPAMAYLDIVRQVRDACSLPVAAYHVSGEYAMLHAAAERGWLDLKETALESTTAMRRAGADWVITYFAPQLAEWL